MKVRGLAGILVLASLFPMRAVADSPDPCDLIAGNEISPAPSIAAADRYADLLTMFGRAPELRNLALRRLKSSADFQDLLDLMDRGGAKGKWRAAAATLRGVIASREEAVLESESGGESPDDLYPYTEAPRVFVLDERGSDGLPQPIYFVAEAGDLVELTFEGGKRRPQIAAIRHFGDFERFGVFDLGGTRLLYRLVDGMEGDQPPGERIEVSELTLTAAQSTGAPERPFCVAQVMTTLIHRLEPYVSGGARAPRSDILPGLPYMLTSLLDRPDAGDAPDGQTALQILDSSSGATRGIQTAAPTDLVAAETRRDVSVIEASLAVIGLDRYAAPGAKEARSAAPNIRDLIGAGGWDTEMLVLADPGEPTPALCAVLGVSSASSLEAWTALLNTGRVSGIITCTILPPGKPGDAASAIIADRIAAESGDGLAYRVIENEIIIGLPDAN
ncbi:MAG TPA: hypothetical protein PLR41_03835 [Alphaproteobacteria bacterium]|nr:hypothetical protein [Alphaproteobacteria bacterium]